MTTPNLFDEPIVDMTQSPTLAPRLERARRTGRVRAEQAGAHADVVKPGWMVDAARAVVFFAGRQSAPWLVEQARRDAEQRGLSAPPDKRAWGAVIQALKRRGLIAMAGYAPSASSNGSPKCLWQQGPRTSLNA